MNNKGFTLVELMAVLVLLSIIVGITLGVFRFNFSDTKKKTEEAFVETIKDSLDIYLTSKEAKKLNFNMECSNVLKKTYGDVKIYKDSITYKSVIDSEYHPIMQDDLINPADKDKICADANDIIIDIYRDDDYVYYYSVNKSEFECLNNIGGEYKEVISTLPEGFSCE